MIDWPRILRALTGKPEPVVDKLEDFKTLSELEAWFDLHKELRMPSPNLCDDYSRESRTLAEMDGKYLSCELVYQNKLYGQSIFTKEDIPDEPETIYHIANLAIVEEDQSCWYVDLAWNKLIRICNFYTGGKY